MDNLAIRLSGVSKKYTLHHEKPTLIENILSRKNDEEFWALKNINLEIKKGEKLGIIGPNGSGKTTLLEIIAGITIPTKGKVVTKGKIVSLIELQAGFHPELTGEENIFLNGMLIGMSKSEIAEKKDSIIDFSGIGKFIDSPLFSYSSGMALRLGFSIAIHSDPDILLLDENIHVGDREFTLKSKRKLRELTENGITFVLVSQWMEFISEYCKKGVVLSGGELVYTGTIAKAIKYYTKTFFEKK